MIYVYRCDCKKEQELFRSVDDRDLPVLCDECGFVCKRVFAPSSQKHAECQGFWSNTMGTSIEQLPEERRAHPNWKFGNDGRVWIPNLKEQRKMAKSLGMVGLDDNVG